MFSWYWTKRECYLWSDLAHKASHWEHFRISPFQIFMSEKKIRILLLHHPGYFCFAHHNLITPSVQLGHTGAHWGVPEPSLQGLSGDMHSDYPYLRAEETDLGNWWGPQLARSWHHEPFFSYLVQKAVPYTDCLLHVHFLLGIRVNRPFTQHLCTSLSQKFQYLVPKTRQPLIICYWTYLPGFLPRYTLKIVNSRSSLCH